MNIMEPSEISWHSYDNIIFIKMVKAHVGKSIACPINGADKLGICLQEKEIRIILSTLYKKKIKMDQIL